MTTRGTFLTVRVTPGERREARLLAAAEGTDLSSLVRGLIRERARHLSDNRSRDGRRSIGDQVHASKGGESRRSRNQ